MKQYTKSIRGKLYKYFTQKLRLNKSTKGWYRGDCVFCGGNYTMGIHIEQNRVHCFKCEEKTSLIKTLLTIEGFDTLHEAWKFLNIQQEYEQYTDEIGKQITREVKQVNLPKSFKLVTRNPPEVLGKIARDYLTIKRGFSLRNLILKGVGYCTAGEYAGYVIFPFYRNGKLIYFQGRRFMEIGTKMKNPKNDDFGVGKEDIFYNEDSLYIYRRIKLVESVTNAITWGDSAVGINGKSISDRQFNRLIMSPCEVVDIVLDPDALNKAAQLALNLCMFKKVRVVILPNNEDINSLGKTATKKIIKNTPLGTYQDFLKLKLTKFAPTVYTYN